MAKQQRCGVTPRRTTFPFYATVGCHWMPFRRDLYSNLAFVDNCTALFQVTLRRALLKEWDAAKAAAGTFLSTRVLVLSERLYGELYERTAVLSSRRRRRRRAGRPGRPRHPRRRRDRR